MKNLTSRRNMLISTVKGALACTSVSVLAPVILAACKKGDPREAELAVDQDAVLASSAYDLTAEQKSARDALGYIDKTKDDQYQTCDNCKLYTLPIKGNSLGGCKILPGPVQAKGYCKAWIGRM